MASGLTLRPCMPPVYDCLQYARIAYSMQELLTVCKNCLQYARIAYGMQELLMVCKNFSLNCKTGSKAWE